MKKFIFLLLLSVLAIHTVGQTQTVHGKGAYFNLKEIYAKGLPKSPATTAGSSATKAEIAQLQDSMHYLKLYGIIAIVLLAFIIFRVTFTMNYKLQLAAQAADAKLNATKTDLDRYIYELEKEAIRIDNRLIQVLHEQLSIIKDGKGKGGAPASDIPGMPSETDHRLAIKVSEEIHRMRKRIENMDKEIKGLSALTNSINRLNEELSGNGYEMEDLMGKKYVDGMKMEARFVDNPDIPPGEEIITEVLRPEIKFKGQVIQVAKVEVGKSY